MKATEMFTNLARNKKANIFQNIPDTLCCGFNKDTKQNK